MDTMQPQGGFEGRRRGQVPERPKPEKPPVSTEVKLEDLLLRLILQHETLAGILSELREVGKNKAGIPAPYDNYYNTGQTIIANATPNPAAGQLLEPDGVTAAGTPNYQREQVHVTLQRNAPKIGVINDGSSIIYVIATQDAETWSNEAPVLPGEARFFYNVWELRLRSPNAGNLALLTGGIYRVTEYDFWLSYSAGTTITAQGNRPAFTAQVVNAPVLGALLPNIIVPGGYALVVRANILNAGQVFVANSIANATNAAIPGNRNTLNAGDTVRLYITNANLVAVAGSGAGQNVDIIVEQ